MAIPGNVESAVSAFDDIVRRTPSQVNRSTKRSTPSRNTTIAALPALPSLRLGFAGSGVAADAMRPRPVFDTPHQTRGYTLTVPMLTPRWSNTATSTVPTRFAEGPLLRVGFMLAL